MLNQVAFNTSLYGRGILQVDKNNSVVEGKSCPYCEGKVEGFIQLIKWNKSFAIVHLHCVDCGKNFGFGGAFHGR